MTVRFEELSVLWEDGERRVQSAAPPLQAALERIVDAVVLELRRRIGARFTADELAAHYLREGVDWCYEVAYRTAPEAPAAWDVAAISGAAYARYVRHASDYGGGAKRHLDAEP